MRRATTDDLAMWIDSLECPECGELGSPSVAMFEGGITAVIPRFQCDTENCQYNSTSGNAWTLALRG